MLSPSSCWWTTNSFWCGFQVHFLVIVKGVIYGNHVHHVLPTLWIRIRFIRHTEDRGDEKTKNEKMFDGWPWLKREDLTRSGAWLSRRHGHTFPDFSIVRTVWKTKAGSRPSSLGQTDLGRLRMCHHPASDLRVPEVIGVSQSGHVYTSVSHS